MYIFIWALTLWLSAICAAKSYSYKLIYVRTRIQVYVCVFICTYMYIYSAIYRYVNFNTRYMHTDVFASLSGVSLRARLMRCWLSMMLSQAFVGPWHTDIC